MSKLDTIVKIYRNLSKTQSLFEAKVLPGGVINSIWIQRNLETGKPTKYLKTHVVNNNFTILSETLPCDISSELLHTVSPSAKKRAVLREINEKDKRKQFLEIWSNSNLTHSVDLQALNKHGDVYTDGEFRSFAWSPDETKVMYVAEEKLPKYEPFYKREPEKPGTTEPAIKGEEYVYRQEWGEQLVGKHKSVIAMYDTNEDTVKVIEGIPSEICPAQVIWSLDGESLIGVGFCTEPRKLGLVYCSNRPSYIFKLDFANNFIRLSALGKSARGPTISPDGKYLVWLERNSDGPHQAVMSLMRLDISVDIPCKPATVIGVVETQISTNNGRPFYGLFNPTIPTRCWTLDERRLILSTSKSTTMQTYVIDIETCVITELISDDDSSQIILDVFNDILLLSRKNYLCPDKLIATNLPEKGEETEIQWKEITEVENIELLNNAMYKSMVIEQDTNDSVKQFTAIYFGPKHGTEKQVPLIVWPHGGPHSFYFNAFGLEAAVLVSLGFAIVFVNYRGSIGAGEANVRFLLGRVGDSDVKDCVLAAQTVCKQFSWINPENMVLAGGSHGGFLVHHLSGQYPDMFKAVVSRNPVIDIACLNFISDIPDWCAVEVGAKYAQEGKVDNDLLLKMRKASPIQHAHKIKAPTYLMLGSKDLRVPFFQGLELYHRLKVNNVPVKLCVYKDNHSLSSGPNEMDHVINSALWFLSYTS